MMYEILYQYLLQNKNLQVPGIGTFWVNRNPAVINFPEKQVDPPSFSIIMKTGNCSPSKHFYYWLASVLNISDRDAIIRFNDFSFEAKKIIADGGTVDWKGVGVLSKGLGGDVKFLPAEFLLKENPVSAEKIIREKAEHMVRVGDDHKTSAEMVDLLNKSGRKKNYWWAISIVIGLLALLFIGWYVSMKGIVPATSENTKSLIPGEPPSSTYKVVP